MDRAPSLIDALIPYDALLCDVWGVLHDGYAAWPDAVEAIHRVTDSGRAVVLVTNTPAGGDEVLAQMAGFGFDVARLAGVVTAGTVATGLMEALAIEHGRRAWFVGADRRRAWPLAHGITLVDAPEQADFALLTDPIAIQGELARGVAAGLPMMCANPDLSVTSQQGVVRLCAGSAARDYEQLGGTVHYAGKPYRPIFDAARALLPADARPVMLGDSPATDLVGARDAGLPAVWLCRDADVDVEGVCARLEVAPVAVLRDLG